MPIKFACICGQKIQVEDRFAGKRIKCPRCKDMQLIPQADDPEEEEEQIPAKPVQEAKSGKKVAKPPSEHEDDEEDEDQKESTSKGKKKKKKDKEPTAPLIGYIPTSGAVVTLVRCVGWLFLVTGVAVLVLLMSGFRLAFFSSMGGGLASLLNALISLGVLTLGMGYTVLGTSRH
jgi:phage FluMu protein Com